MYENEFLNSTFVKPFKLKLKVYIPVTTWLFDLKSS